MVLGRTVKKEFAEFSKGWTPTFAKSNRLDRRIRRALRIASTGKSHHFVDILPLPELQTLVDEAMHCCSWCLVLKQDI